MQIHWDNLESIEYAAEWIVLVGQAQYWDSGS